MGTVAPKILLAEDDRVLRRAGEISLRQKGYTVLLAEDGEEAVRVIHAEQPDLVLLDLLMPKMSGLDVLQAIRANEKTKTIAVFILTNNYVGEKYIKQLNELGVMAYLIKSNLSLQELGNIVARHFEKLTDG